MAPGSSVSLSGYQAVSRYDDVWAKEAEICAFCAAPYNPDASRCSGCGRNLLRSRFTYASASTNQVVLWVLIASSGFLYLMLILADVIQGNGADYFMAGRRHAQDGRWASAILHWQRAAAKEPANWRFQLALAEAYGLLGFTSRSADVLQSASALAGRAGAAEIEQLRRRLAQQTAASDRD